MYQQSSKAQGAFPLHELLLYWFKTRYDEGMLTIIWADCTFEIRNNAASERLRGCTAGERSRSFVPEMRHMLTQLTHSQQQADECCAGMFVRLLVC